MSAASLPLRPGAANWHIYDADQLLQSQSCRNILSTREIADPMYQLPSATNSSTNLKAGVEMGVELVSLPNYQHALFCRLMGIKPGDFEEEQGYPLWGGRRQKDKHLRGLYPRVRAAYRRHAFQYWAIATVVNVFLVLQLILGAALTALGGTKGYEVAAIIVVLGAINTIISGFIAYFKSTNQPNRARQYRIALRKVLEAIENAEMMLRDPDYHPPPYRPVGSIDSGLVNNEHWLSGEPGAIVTGVEGMVLRLMDMYNDAVRDAENNSPGTWFSTNRSANQPNQIGMKDILVQLQKNGAVQSDTASIAGSYAPSTVGLVVNAAPVTSTAAPTSTSSLAPPDAPAATHAAATKGIATGATLTVPQLGAALQASQPQASQPQPSAPPQYTGHNAV